MIMKVDNIKRGFSLRRVKGGKDAAGEVGVINNTSGQFELKASKYNRYDRWNMFFS